MAGFALGAASDLAGKAAGAVDREAQRFAADPVMYLTGKAITAGTALSIAGAIFAILAGAVQRQEQAYLNDIQDRLGLDRSTPPTPPKPGAAPPTPTTQSLFYTICNSLGNLDTSSAANLIAQLDGVNTQATTFRQLARGTVTNSDGSTTDTATLPGSGDADLDTFFFAIADARGEAGNTVEHRSPGLHPMNVPGDPTAWDSVKTYVAKAHNAANALASDIGWTPPFAEPSAGGTTGNSFWSGLLLVTGVDTLIGYYQTGVQTYKNVTGWLSGIGAAASSDFNVIGRAIVNLPFLAWDGLGYAATWGADTILNDLWPPMLALGLGLVVAGVAGRFVYTRLWPRYKVHAAAAFERRVIEPLDRRLGIERDVITVDEAKRVQSAVTEAAEPMPPPSPQFPDAEPPKIGDAIAKLNARETPVGQEPSNVSGAPAVTPADAGVSPPAPVEPTPTETTEEILGDAPNLRQQRMALEHETKVETSGPPPPPPPVPPPPTVVNVTVQTPAAVSRPRRRGRTISEQGVEAHAIFAEREAAPA